MQSDKNMLRREVLGGISGIGAIGLAGCLGDGGNGTGGTDTDDSGTASGNGNGTDSGSGNDAGSSGGKTDVTVGMGTGGTTEQMTQALQRVVSEEAESVRFVTEGTSGDPENIRLYNQGNVDGYTGNNSSIIAAMNDESPFAERPVDKLAAQGFLLHTFHFHWLAVNGSGIETTDDLAGKNVWPLAPSWGIRQLAEEVHKNAGMWKDISSNVVNIDAGDVAGAIDEGRIDAFIGYGANFSGLPSWLSEVDARADIHALDVTDTLKQGIKDTSGLTPKEIDVYGYSQDIGKDTLTVWDEPGQLWFGDAVSEEAAYEIASISHNNIKQIKNGQSSYPDHSEIDLMTSGYMSELPVHPGVAKFLRENDAWNDEWSEGTSWQ